MKKIGAPIRMKVGGGPIGLFFLCGQHRGPPTLCTLDPLGGWSLNLSLKTFKIPRIGCKRPPQC